MSVVYRDATADERRMIEALCPSRVRYLPGSWDKRFARKVPHDRITEGQADQIRRLVRKYRRQLPPEIVALVPEDYQSRMERTAELRTEAVKQGMPFLEACQLELPT